MRVYYRPVEDGDQELAVLSVGQLLIQLSPGIHIPSLTMATVNIDMDFKLDKTDKAIIML